jgi:hypothetical protein
MSAKTIRVILMAIGQVLKGIVMLLLVGMFAVACLSQHTSTAYSHSCSSPLSNTRGGWQRLIHYPAGMRTVESWERSRRSCFSR